MGYPWDIHGTSFSKRYPWISLGYPENQNIDLKEKYAIYAYNMQKYSNYVLSMIMLHEIHMQNMQEFAFPSLLMLVFWLAASCRGPGPAESPAGRASSHRGTAHWHTGSRSDSAGGSHH